VIVATGILVSLGSAGAGDPYSRTSPDSIEPPAQAGTSSPAVSSTPPIATVTPDSRIFSLTPAPTTLLAFVRAPAGLVSAPYIVLDSFSFEQRSVTFQGILNSQEFFCGGSPCRIPLEFSSTLVFRAVDDASNSSREIIATVTVIQQADGFRVTIDDISEFTFFSNSCSAVWGVGDEQGVTWDDFVQSPHELNTDKTLHLLASKLLLFGLADASSCPAGGLGPGLDWPTACGLEAAAPAMIAWQNQFDATIWFASRDYGIPPKILKSLIEIESQFWPQNSRFYLDEFGLGQINALGVDILLRRDNAFYQSVCREVFSDCSAPYAVLSESQQTILRGAAVQAFDASCADCPLGFDLDKAKSSVVLIARLLKANCEQVQSILDDAATRSRDPKTPTATPTTVTATPTAIGASVSASEYEDLWRFTLVSYHSGLSCFQEAVLAVREEGKSLNWDNLASELLCRSGVRYANGFMDVVKSFDLNLYQADETEAELAVAQFSPTRTLMPTPTLFVSTARIVVQAFIDRDGDGSLDAGEGIDSLTVQVSVAGIEQAEGRTQEGIVTFDMSGFMPGSVVTVNLPGLYRSESFALPAEGEVIVSFQFDQPALPTNLP